jgi:hypothetical protein
MPCRYVQRSKIRAVGRYFFTRGFITFLEAGDVTPGKIWVTLGRFYKTARSGFKLMYTIEIKNIEN